MGYTIADCILIPLILVGLFYALRWCFRRLRICYREVMDCVYVAKRGVLNPAQVREEFIATTGREPSVQEVHDMYEMIKDEHHRAVGSLVAVFGGIIAAIFVFHHELNKG